VATLQGFGKYYFEVDLVNYTNTITRTSYDFQLMPYSEESADGTVKLKPCIMDVLKVVLITAQVAG